MSEDLIRRSDAIKAIEELPNVYNGWSDAYDKAYIIGTLEEVPSADRPQGVWIEKNVDDVKITVCSNCDKEPTFTHYYGSCGNYSLSDFCPNCGARMKGADDE